MNVVQERQTQKTDTETVKTIFLYYALQLAQDNER
jgi:hypothetical protein